MSIEEPILKFHSSPLSDEFKNLAKHVENCFQLNLFMYSIITPSGLGLQISNQSDGNINYFINKHYIHNPFIRHPDNYKHNQTLITDDFKNVKEYKSFFKHANLLNRRFGFENFLSIYKKEQGNAHRFTFSSNNEKILLNTLFLNNLYSLVL